PDGSVATLASAFPITPSRTYAASELTKGNIHVDILARRESVRGNAGGSGAVDLDSGAAHLSVLAGSLPGDTAVAFESAPVSGFVPSLSGLVALQEMLLDLSGATLSKD